MSENMTIKDLIQRVCEDGIASVKKHEKGARQRGGIKGFNLAKEVENIEELARLIKREEVISQQITHDYHESKATIDDHWEHRYIVLQLEWVYEVLKVAYRDMFPSVSARALRKYADIVGVATP